MLDPLTYLDPYNANKPNEEPEMPKLTKIEELLKKHGIENEIFEALLTAIIEGFHDDSVEIVPDEVQYPAGFWKPEEDQEYRYFDENGDLLYDNWDGCEIDLGRLSIGNIYRIESEAEHAFAQKQAYAELVRKITELNHDAGWVCDWEDFKQRKSRFDFNHDSKVVGIVNSERYQEYKTELYFKPELFQKLIDTTGAEKIKLALWGIV